MSIAASFLLIIFSFFFTALIVMSLVHLFHAWRFGDHMSLANLTSGIFLAGIGVIILATFVLLRAVDWSQSFDVTLPSFNISAPPQSL